VEAEGSLPCSKKPATCENAVHILPFYYFMFYFNSTFPLGLSLIMARFVQILLQKCCMQIVLLYGRQHNKLQINKPILLHKHLFIILYLLHVSILQDHHEEIRGTSLVVGLCLKVDPY
jgi:hypothetical protein